MEINATDSPSAPTGGGDGRPSSPPIRTFRLSLNGVTAELCSLGASITKLLLPSPAHPDRVDDCVLGYASPLDALDTGNAPYFGVVVGRVANRIGGGAFRLDQERPGGGGGEREVVEYRLDRNDGPNHLHGGVRGFGRRVWDAEEVEVTEGPDGDGSARGVRFALESGDGDGGYPGAVRATATYSLRPSEARAGDDGPTPAVALRLSLRASLLSDGLATPINLAQHSYFNLCSHSSPRGILDHVLTLPSEAYTPADDALIPTGEVRGVDVPGEEVMDFRGGRELGRALVEYGATKAGPDEGAAREDVRSRREGRRDPPTGGEPYGYDHNYVVCPSAPARPSSFRGGGRCPLRLAGTAEHPPTRRRMEVWTTAPGVQVYTANFLDGTDPPPDRRKDGVAYGRWQGVCLETQAFPSSVAPDMEGGWGEEFARGRCTVLRPGGEDYTHDVEYVFGVMSP